MQKLYPAAVKQSPAKNDEVGETAYLGGSVVSYILAKVEGDIVAADTLVEAGRLDYELGSKEIPAFGNKAMR